MIVITHQQGSPEWDAHRAKSRNASEAPIIMGYGKISRQELLRLKATGNEKEYSDFLKNVIFARGHRVELACRPIIEKQHDCELYPITGTTDDGYLSASFDGHATYHGEFSWECKQWNEHKVIDVKAGEIPSEDFWQVVHQSAVNDGKPVLYSVSDGTEQRTVSQWYEPNIDDLNKLLAAWRQFDKDLAEYVHVDRQPQAVGKAPDMLPALRIEVTGMVTASNLAEYKEAAIAIFKGISRDLKTDQDFADADKTVKWCKDIEERLAAAKQHALSQTASIDELFRAIDSISEEARTTRLELDKLVKARKESIRAEIVQSGQSALAAHINTINDRLAKVRLTAIDADFAGAIKGKKSFDSMRDSVADELARAKIAADSQAAHIETSLSILRQHAADMPFLFVDAQQLVLKAHDDLTAVIMQRIREHNEAAEKKAREEILRQQQATSSVIEERQAAAGRAFSDAPVVREFTNAVEKDAAEATAATGRPTQEDIIQTLMLCYNQKRDVIVGWLKELKL